MIISSITFLGNGVRFVHSLQKTLHFFTASKHKRDSMHRASCGKVGIRYTMPFLLSMEFGIEYAIYRNDISYLKIHLKTCISWHFSTILFAGNISSMWPQQLHKRCQYPTNNRESMHQVKYHSIAHCKPLCLLINSMLCEGKAYDVRSCNPT
jgi:hypothetical protein